MLRPEIASSWQRAASTGLDPTTHPDAHLAFPVDVDSRLRVAAGPVLDDLAADLDGSRYSLILADRDARLIDIRYGQSVLRPKLDGVGAVPGSTFTEATSGTNSIATALEVGRGISVTASEHYLDAFKRFTCYGTPVSDPVTRRIVGVLDITCLAEDANDLLRPYLTRGAGEIERRLLELSRRSHRAVLEQFERSVARSSDPLVAVAPDLVLCSPTAAALLQPVDHVMLQTLSEEHRRSGAPARDLTLQLADGRAVRATVSTVDGGCLVGFDTGGRPPARPRRGSTPPRPAAFDWLRALRADIDSSRTSSSHVTIHGETGSGRTSLAAEIAGPGAPRVDAATASVRAVRAAVDRASGGALVVESVDEASSAVLRCLADAADTGAVRLVLTRTTSAPGGAEIAPAATSLHARCAVRLDLPTVRSRRDAVPALAAAMVSAGTGGSVRFTAGALRVLAGLPWPGNLRELATVVDHVTAHRSAGDATEADLPAGHRGTGEPTVVGALWRAERDAVVHALQVCGGNKVKAAEMLGIGRGTLYRRLRVLNVDVAEARAGAVPDRHT